MEISRNFVNFEFALQLTAFIFFQIFKNFLINFILSFLLGILINTPVREILPWNLSWTFQCLCLLNDVLGHPEGQGRELRREHVLPLS